MTTFFIDPEASVNGNGSEAFPFNSWASVTWAYGNQYLQKAGTVSTEAINIAPGQFASNKDDGLTVGSYGTANNSRAVIDAVGIASPFIGIKIAEANECQNITIQDFEIKNIEPTVTGNYGIRLYSYGIQAGKHTVKNCYLHDLGWQGIFVQKVNVDIIDNTIEYIGGDALNIVNGDATDYMTVQILRNTIRYPDQNGSDGDCIQFVDGRYYGLIAGNTLINQTLIKQCVMLSGIDNSTFTVENNLMDCEGVGRAGVSCSVAKTYTVRNNIIKNTAIAGAINAYNDTGSIAAYVGPETSYIYDNLVLNCKQGIICSGTSTTPHIQDIHIYNNTVLDCDEAFRFYGRATITAKGNIVGAVDHASGQALYVQSTVDSYVEDANIYWPEFTQVCKDYRAGLTGNYDTVAAYIADAQPTSTSKGVDPLLTSGHKPHPTSYAVENGPGKWWNDTETHRGINGELHSVQCSDIGAYQLEKAERNLKYLHSKVSPLGLKL